MGSSMILKMMVDQVVAENGLDCRVSSDMAASTAQSTADILVAGSDLAPTLDGSRARVVGITNIMDKKEILAGISDALSSLEQA
jgi:PTS system ascorbate-specific IIB component